MDLEILNSPIELASNNLSETFLVSEFLLEKLSSCDYLSELQFQNLICYLKSLPQDLVISFITHLKNKNFQLFQKLVGILPEASFVTTNS